MIQILTQWRRKEGKFESYEVRAGALLALKNRESWKKRLVKPYDTWKHLKSRESSEAGLIIRILFFNTQCFDEFVLSFAFQDIRCLDWDCDAFENFCFVLGADEYLERLEGKIRKCLFFYVVLFCSVLFIEDCTGQAQKDNLETIKNFIS